MVNFLDVIKNSAKLIRAKHKDNIVNFYEGFKFYLLIDKTDFVLAVKILGANSISKIKYSLNGVVFSSVSDVAVDDIVLRSSGEKQHVIRNGNIVSLTKNIKLKALEKPTMKRLLVEYGNIGVIDIETYKATDQTYKVYAVGYKTNLWDRAVAHYIDRNTLDSSKLILDLLDELIKPKYEKVKFYCHNLGGFDIVFILKVLFTYNDNNSIDEYKVSCVLRNGKILKVRITKGKNS